MSKRRVGSSLDDFLKEEGIFEDTQSQAIKEVVAWQLAQAMKSLSLSKSRMATLLKTSRSQVDRLLDAERFDIGPADFAVRTTVGLRSPDVVVDYVTPRRDLSTDVPLFIAEVLSPSTTGIDFTEKLEEYTSIATLQTYLICSQDEPRAWVWSRQGDGAWPMLPAELAGREGTIDLRGLDIEISMAAIFRGIPDAPTPG